MDDTTKTKTTDHDAHPLAIALGRPTEIDREEREQVMLAALAEREAWADYRVGLDIPSTTDWLVACAHQIEAWSEVNSILNRYVAGSLSIEQASADLDLVLS